MRERIKEKAGNCCFLCHEWCGDTGSPHHVIKVSEMKLLENCERNIYWLCKKCHGKTETSPGYNRLLQKGLQKMYITKFESKRYYNIKEIVQIVNIKEKDLEKAMQKGLLKWEFVGDVIKSSGENCIRFFVGGYLK